MKKLLMLIPLAALTLAGCNAPAKDVGNALIDIATADCVIANAALQDPDVMKVCKVVEAIAPAVKQLLFSHRRAAERAASARCAEKK